jgi:SAM-dependent methyltransferase
MSAVSEVEVDHDALVARLFSGTVTALEMLSLALGDRLGMYAVLRDAGPMTIGEFAERASIDPRYAREWLEQQTIAGFLTVDDPTRDAHERAFTLPEAHVAALADRDSLDHLAPLARLVAGVARPMDALVQAYRTGGGVPWEAYGVDAREGQAYVNRPAFLHLLPTEWLGAMPDVADRLGSAPSTIADLGCGGGFACIGMARAFPLARVEGYDLDEASVQLARANVREAGLDDRIAIHHIDVSEIGLTGRFDLVTVLETLHDLPRPVELLANARAMTAEGGAVLVADERVADTFGACGDEIERLMYGWSVLCCLPAGMTDPDSAATGTVMRHATLEQYASKAGFARVEVLPVENDFFRLYRLHPSA